MKTPTFKDLIDFIVTHKTNKTFLGMSKGEIEHQVLQGLNNETMYYTTDIEGNITGMILAEKREESGILFVTENLAMNISNLRIFAKMAKQRLGNYKLEWLKRGIHKSHSTDKIYKKLAI